jgi:hypothetical protein
LPSCSCTIPINLPLSFYVLNSPLHALNKQNCILKNDNNKNQKKKKQKNKKFIMHWAVYNSIKTHKKLHVTEIVIFI